MARADATDACIKASDEGQVLRDQGKLLAARARFLTCSRDACPRLVRADCTTWLADADNRIPTVVLSAQDTSGHDTAAVRVTLDGAPLADKLEARAIPVDPGQHRFRFELPGSAPVEETVILREGELRRPVSVRFAAPETHAAVAPPVEPPASGPSRGAVAVAVSLGAVALGGGAIFAYAAATAESDADHLRATCAPGCNPADVDAVRTKLIAGNAALGVGIAAALAAVGVLLWGPRAAVAKPAVSVRVLPAPAGGGALRGAAGGVVGQVAVLMRRVTGRRAG